MRAFVTVGSTHFDALVDAALSQSVLEALLAKGYNSVAIQCGNYKDELAGLGLGSTTKEGVYRRQQFGVEVEIWRFRASLQDAFEQADLVISHAGSGTIIDVLRMGKRLIVVPNASLLDNHQAELAEALQKLEHLKACDIRGLPECIMGFDSKTLKPFPPMDPKKFANLMDQEMGFDL